MPGPGPVPVREEFVAVKREPLEYEGASAFREVAAHLAVANRDGGLELGVCRMEVRRIVIAVHNGDGDAEEARDDRMSRI